MIYSGKYRAGDGGILRRKRSPRDDHQQTAKLINRDKYLFWFFVTQTTEVCMDRLARRHKSVLSLSFHLEDSATKDVVAYGLTKVLVCIAAGVVVVSEGNNPDVK